MYKGVIVWDSAVSTTKRSAEDQENSDGTGRSSKRLKPSPGTTSIAPADSPLHRLVVRLVKDIEKIPANLIISCLGSVLDCAVDDKFRAKPNASEYVIPAIDLQITTLTEKDRIESKYVLIERLQQLKDLLSPFHEAITTPYSFGKHWKDAQEGPDAILCLRPPDKQGLPLITLHEAFLFFVNELKKLLPATEVDALKAAYKLSGAMAESYESEPKRRDTFNRNLDPFISQEKWLPELGFGDQPGMAGRLDGALMGYSLLREDRGELGSDGDPYMQIARGFQAFVMWKQSQDSPYGKPGVAKFLLILSGSFIMIAGGFYDGKRTIVEPLTPSIPMLPDYNIEGRPMTIAQCLIALKKAVDLIYVPAERAVIAATPCIYSSLFSSGGTEIPISFVKPLPVLGSLMFLATATIESKPKECLVKLVYGRYGVESHRLLAHDGLAPGLLGVQIKEGAPTAIAMEYLKLYSLGSEGWTTLYSFAQKPRAPDVQKGLAIAVHEILRKLEQANLVHGDLRANNLMVYVNANGTMLDVEKVRVKAIDFDWDGQSGERTYPLWRNSDISWPAEIGEAIVVGHEQALVTSWWGKMFRQQPYPPVG